MIRNRIQQLKENLVRIYNKVWLLHLYTHYSTEVENDNSQWISIMEETFGKKCYLTEVYLLGYGLGQPSGVTTSLLNPCIRLYGAWTTFPQTDSATFLQQLGPSGSYFC